jgi:pyruvate formate lyase activating enzyme
LYCQNWHYRLKESPGSVSAEDLAMEAHSRTECVCFFGGDPSAQMPHALAAARLLADKGLRICWETNGSMRARFLKRAVELSLATGGCIKIDIKAFSEELHIALTGVSNSQTLDNFELAARRFLERPEPPLVIASTLLVPGYVDVQEVRSIADFVARINPGIPYALLGFHPSFFVPDLPRTSASHAEAAEAAARQAGLRRVRVGNRQLLSLAYK